MKKIILLPFISLLMLLIACEDKNSDLATTSSGESEVKMIFNTESITRSSSPVEDDKVVELDLVVCKDGFYQYRRRAYSSEYATFRSTLKIEKDIDIYFFANTRSVLEENDELLQEGTSWEQIQQQLLIHYTDTVINGKKVLPMWGELKNVEITDNVINNLGLIVLLRTVASTNIYFTLNPEKNGGYNFTPQVAYVYYGADKAFVAMEEGNLIYQNGQIAGVKKPLAPTTMRTVRNSEAKTTGNSFVNSLYMFDNPTDESSQDRKRTRIVVGGKINGIGETVYYPLDFSNSETKEILRVTRNHQYNMIITAVKGEGYPDPDEAAENAPANLDYKVIEWDKHTDEDIMIDGVNYLSVSKKQVILYPQAGSKTQIKLSGTFQKGDFSFAFLNNLNGPTSTTADTASNNRFKSELEGEGTELTLTISALQDYNKDELKKNFDTLQVEVGRIKFVIQIEQIDSPGWDNGGNQGIEF